MKSSQVIQTFLNIVQIYFFKIRHMMATSNKKNAASNDVSTDSDDSVCAKNRSDSNTNETSSSSSKYRGY